MQSLSWTERRTTYSRRTSWRFATAGILGLVVLAALMTGCHDSGDKQAESKRSGNGGTVVRIVKPELRTIDYAIDEPSVVDAYEQTSIFSKVSGFIKHFDVDIGQEVKTGDLLAEIFVPE